MQVSTEIEDEFTRETLADLVTHRLTTGGSTAGVLATRLGIESMCYLEERQLRVLGFMVMFQGMQPSTRIGDQAAWTEAVIKYFREHAPLVLVPNELDLLLLGSLSLVSIMPSVARFQITDGLKGPNGELPLIDQFLREDELGKTIKAGWDVSWRYRLNIAGFLVGITAANKITGTQTDISSLMRS